MAGPTDTEQLYLELINDARLNPMGNAARYISSYGPLTSSDPDIQSALNYFNVSGSALKSAFQALVPVAPVAWNDSLATASRAHNAVMIQYDVQTHQYISSTFTEPSFDQRDTNAGYTGWSGLGENVFAYADSAIYGHAGFMVDWGGDASTGGMQSPAGHRLNIMNASWTEVGVGVTLETDPLTQVGPQVVTQDFGTRGHHFILGVAYTDSDANGFYSVGEGRADLTVAIGATSVISTTSGGYALDLAGTSGRTITLSGGGITGSATVIAQSLAQNLKLDVVGGTTLKISGSAVISGFARIEGLGVTGLNLAAGAGSQTLVGTPGHDTLAGGAGDDTLGGGGGMDVAVYSGTTFAQATVSRPGNGTLLVTTPADGTDRLTGVEQVQFSDGLKSFVFRGPGPAVLANFNPANGWTSQDQNPRHLADVNGDGNMDIVGFGTAGVLVSFGAANGTFSGAGLAISNFGQTAGWTSDNSFHRELADVNGDGRADIVGFGIAGTLVSLAKADGTYNNPITGVANFGANQGWTSQNGFARFMGDVNGDGKADIVGFGFAGTLVSLGNGDGTFKPVQTALANFGVNQGWTSDNTSHRAVADVNGDGKADLIGFGTAGTYVALSNGDGTFATAQLVLNDFGANQGWSNNDSFSRLVADVNGDHVADVVGFGVAGTIVAFGKGDGTFTAAGTDLGNFGANQGWTSDNTYHREVVDMNHDGLADIVGFGIAGVLVGQNQADFLVL